MVMSIISAVASSVQLSLAVDAAAWDIYYIDYFGCYYHAGDHRPGNAVDVRYLLTFFLLGTFRICRHIFDSDLGLQCAVK